MRPCSVAGEARFVSNGDSMSILYVVGGRAKSNARRLPEFHGFESAVILEVDTETLAVREAACWQSAPDVCPDHEPSFVFKAGTLTPNKLWVCTQTEIIGYSLPDFAVQDYITQTFFNDLHHVRPTRRNTLLVAVTGLDMIAEIAMDGALIEIWPATDEPVREDWKSNDFRKIPTTKPHRAHPNYLFEFENKYWATRFVQRDAVELGAPNRTIQIGGGGPHDGHLEGTNALFTTVNGNLVSANLRTCSVEAVLHLSEICGHHKLQPLGWCRGIRRLSSGHVCVGFSRLRPTAFKENLRWARSRILDLANLSSPGSHNLPTRIACLNIDRRKLNWQLNLETEGINAIFSIHEVGNPDFLPTD